MPGPFQTPQNERSFSALIDQVILDTGRPAALLSAIGYGNATLRQCHALGLFYRDLKEDQILATAQPMIWERPAGLRKLRTVQYDTCKVYPKLLLPGRQQQCERHYYYSVDTYYVFAGVQLQENINIAKWQWAPSFSYYTRLGDTTTAQLVGSSYTTRPAYYDKEELQWYYLNTNGTAYVTTLGDPDEEERRRNLTLDWLLQDYWEVILEGTSNKVFNKFGDARAGGTFSQYTAMQKDIKDNEAFESEGF